MRRRGLLGEKHNKNKGDLCNTIDSKDKFNKKAYFIQGPQTADVLLICVSVSRKLE